jgi:3-oxoacyl-[acyl-carrier-protein] synthase II
MADRRVVVTGYGIVTCNARDTAEYADAIFAGRQGIAPLTRMDTKDLGSKFGGEVKLTDEQLAGDDPKSAKRKDRFVLMALYAAREAMRMSQLDYRNWENPFRVGTIISAGIGGLCTLQEETKNLLERGPRRVSPFLIPKMIPDSAAGDISIVYGSKGPNYAITTACATATHCMGSALQQIRLGTCDVAITGGCEAPLCSLGVAGFNSIKALSTRNDSPATASRPFDADRDGFVMAEGAGVLVFEELDRAKARGAQILGEVVGFACTGDAYHETAPDPEGRAGIACMQLALADAKLAPERIGYFNAHGTSTKYNDACETMIIKRVFGDHARRLPISSTKSLVGHTLGAAGAVEGIATLLSLQRGVLHPTINYTTPDPECDLDYIPNTAREAKVDYALSNSLGFGGHNASIIFKRFTG